MRTTLPKLTDIAAGAAAAAESFTHQLSEGFGEAGFPDEKERIDVVAAPEFQLLEGADQRVLFRNQAAVGVEQKLGLSPIGLGRFDLLRDEFLEQPVDVAGRRLDAA